MNKMSQASPAPLVKNKEMDETAFYLIHFLGTNQQYFFKLCLALRAGIL